MPQSAKYFAERLNHCLNEVDAPRSVRERAVILCKMLDIPRQQAWSLLEGQQLPGDEFINYIAGEFEVDPKWLSGEK